MSAQHAGSHQDVARFVIGILRRHLGSYVTVTSSSRLIGDLGLDSLDFVAVTYDIRAGLGDPPLDSDEMLRRLAEDGDPTVAIFVQLVEEAIRAHG